jgi:flagellar protein FliJ
MKAFRFSLRPVSVLRAHRELRAREAFAAAVHAYMQSDEELAATCARVAQFEAALCEGRGAHFSASEQARALAAYRRERLAEAEAESARQSAHQAMQQRRADYLEAHRKLEVVRRLEEKARGAHRLAAGREEQAGYDELAARRCGARRPTLFPV